ncbi:hypothetical protein N7540_007897 [Penicillium herquei]|nr:hypothetical protein N7540_007897 [Penicillium herquei]
MATSVSCLCGGVALSVHLDPFTDHAQLQLCHCNNCRSVTGLLCTSYYLMQHEPTPVGQLQEYQESPHVSRFFCRTCGAHAFVKAGDKFFVASGLLAAENVPPVKSMQHWKVDDADGGLGKFLPGETTNVSCRLNVLTEEGRTVIKIPAQLIQLSQYGLDAQCHCGGIKFHLTRPNASSFRASSPWPDLLVPYHSDSAENPGNIKWWLQGDNTKYLAGTCACPSCRLASGFPIQAWAFVPKSNILQSDGLQLRFSEGTLRQYLSSPGVYREFCGRCGATAFWHNDERPELIDVSVGLLRGSDALAQDWFVWATRRVSFSEMAIQRDLVHLLEQGLNRSAHHDV